MWPRLVSRNRVPAPQGPAGEAGGQAGALLRARALWLVGTCGGGLPPELYADALAGLVGHLAAPDLVAALAAAQAVAALATRLMIEDSVRAAPCRMPAGDRRSRCDRQPFTSLRVTPMAL